MENGNIGILVQFVVNLTKPLSYKVGIFLLLKANRKGYNDNENGNLLFFRNRKQCALNC
jgi:hypothetical protein